MGPLTPNPVELVLGLISLLLICGVLGKVLLPRIERVMAEREDATDGCLGRAEALRAEAGRVRGELEEELRAARHEASRIRQAAGEEGSALIEAVREEGRRQRDRLVADAQVQLAADQVIVEAELHEDVVNLATELAGRIIGEPVDSARARATAERFFAERESAPAVDRD